jgi:hypothetical protein
VARLGRQPGAVRVGVRGSLAVAAVAAAGVLAGCSSSLTVPGPAQGTPTAPHTVSLAADGRSRATLDMLTGTTLLRIGTADLGLTGSLLTVSTPFGGPVPQLRLTDSGTAQLGADPLVALSAPNAAEVAVVLNSRVSWQLNLDGGTTRTVADLRGGQVSSISVTAGSSIIALTLPQPHGRVPVQMSGGASELLLSLPGGVPVRVTSAGGAGSVSLEGQEHTGVAGGSVFTTPGWTAGVTGFDIDAIAGASRIAVTARAG